MPKKLLTNRKSKWVKQFKPTVALKGTPLNYNAAMQERYSRKLEKLVTRMTDDVDKSLHRLFKGSTAKEFFAEDASISAQANILMKALTTKWQQIFNLQSKPMAETMADEANASSKFALHQSLKQLSGGLSLKTSIMTGELKTVMHAVVAENVALIKSIPSQYFTQIQGAVMRSISQGNGLQDLQPFFEKQKGFTKRRAKNIALDQTRKAYNGLNKGRMQALKVNQYEWLHSGGSQHPRPQHIAMSGNIYSLDNPPIIDDETGERGIPGQLINCKCRMRPIVQFNEGKPQQ